MATKQELEQENELLKARIASLEHELTLAKALAVPRTHNPLHHELARLLMAEPRSISELAEHFNREPRLISQWIFQLKSKHQAQIITMADGKKSLVNDIFNLTEQVVPQQLNALDEPS